MRIWSPVPHIRSANCHGIMHTISVSASAKVSLHNVVKVSVQLQIKAEGGQEQKLKRSVRDKKQTKVIDLGHQIPECQLRTEGTFSISSHKIQEVRTF